MDLAADIPATDRPLRTTAAKGPLFTDMDDSDAVPWFLWDGPMTVAGLGHRLATASGPDRYRLLGMILHEARDPQVWKFATPAEIARMWPRILRHVGRRRAIWEFLHGEWWQQGRIDFHASR